MTPSSPRGAGSQARGSRGWRRGRAPACAPQTRAAHTPALASVRHVPQDDIAGSPAPSQLGPPPPSRGPTSTCR